MNKHAKETMSKYFTNTLPVEILKALARLNAVSDTAWELVESAKEKGNLKSQTDALRLCKDTARDITEIVTNNRSLIDTAYEITDQKEKELSELVSSSYDTRVVADTVTKTNSGVCDNSSSSCKNDSSATHTNNTNTDISHSDINSSNSSTNSSSI
jgi:hypothetical protein